MRAVSFVGSTAVAQYVYARGGPSGKRAQCQGGAKNPIVVLPDADLDMTTRIVADRRLVARASAASPRRWRSRSARRRRFTGQIADAAVSRTVGYGLDEGCRWDR